MYYIVALSQCGVHRVPSIHRRLHQLAGGLADEVLRG
jgi:hypothetical protein